MIYVKTKTGSDPLDTRLFKVRIRPKHPDLQPCLPVLQGIQIRLRAEKISDPKFLRIKMYLLISYNLQFIYKCTKCEQIWILFRHLMSDGQDPSSDLDKNSDPDLRGKIMKTRMYLFTLASVLSMNTHGEKKYFQFPTNNVKKMFI